MLFYPVPSVFICTGENKKEFKLHLYGKRQTSDSSWKFLKVEKEQMKQSTAILIDKSDVKLLIFK